MVYGRTKWSFCRARDPCTSRTFDCDHLLFTCKALVALFCSIFTRVKVITMTSNTYREFAMKYANVLNNTVRDTLPDFLW